MKLYKVTLLIDDHNEIGYKGILENIENANYPNDCISPRVETIENLIFRNQ